MQGDERLQQTRRAIRRFLDAMDPEEPVDLIFLAAVLCNFDPHRELPFWLVIVAPPGTGKSKLIDMLQGWKHTFDVATGPSVGYFLSTKSEASDQSMLKRVQREKKRILMWSDISSLTSVGRARADEIHSQLIGIHDGYLYRESGVTAKAHKVRFEDSERVGFIAAGTPAWYDFQKYYNSIGTRFSSYYWSRDRWSSTRDLERIIEKQQEDREGYGSRYADARASVLRFLGDAIKGIGGLRSLQLEHQQTRRIAALTAIVSRALTRPGSEGDSGRRLAIRATHLARMLAYMHGRPQVAEYDMQVTFRFLLSQLPPAESLILRWWLLNRETRIAPLDLCATVQFTRRLVDRVIKSWHEVEILTAPNIRNKAFGLSAETKRLAVLADVQPTIGELQKRTHTAISEREEMVT